MNSLESLMSWIVKLVFILLLLPFALSLIVQLFFSLSQGLLTVFMAILPWLLGVAVVIALIAGISAGLSMRYYFPPRSHSGPLRGVTPVKRPRENIREEQN